jgi:hypothetical protein
VSGPNARFKEWANGCEVILTLRPGQSLNWETGGADEEGWSHTGVTWRLDGGMIRREITNDASDCDGRLTSEYDQVARIESIDSERRPNWCEVNSTQHDYAAEAAGY